MGALKCIDFFCGGGGMSQGLSRAGIKVLGALDNDPDCRETYEANHPGSVFIDEDVRKMSPEVLGKKLKIRKNMDDMIFVGCSPCQYWSVINGSAGATRKSGAHKSRNLLKYFHKFVEYYRPGFVLVENVRTIIGHEKDSGLRSLKKLLKKEGYEMDDDVIAACDFGVPQTRQRYVLLASRVGDIKLPKKTGKTATVRQAIHKLSKIKAGEGHSKGDVLHRAAALSKTNIKRLQLTKEGEARTNWSRYDKLLIDAYRGKPVNFYRENYGRMSWDKPAPTITTRFYSISCGRFAHPQQNRAISLREGARLQTFLKTYKFKTKTYQATAKLIGNAVPPKLAKYLGKALVSAAKNG